MDIVIFLIELIGISAYSLSGALTAIEKKLDMFGTVVLGVTTAVGGGILRDLLLGNTPPRSFVSPVYVAVGAVFAAVPLIPYIRNILIKNNKIYNKVMFVLDTIGLGFFTVMGVGVAYATSTDFNMFLVTFVGVITGVGGGILRDVLAGNVPYIFIKHIYALASVAGAVVCALLWEVLGEFAAMLLGMAVIVVIRCMSAHYRWNLMVK